MSSKSSHQASFDVTSGATRTNYVILFEVGSSSQTITVNVISNSKEAPKETITVTLSNPIVPNTIPSCDASITTTNVIDGEILEILSLIQLI